VFLIHCPRCRGQTAADDDAEWIHCRWCKLPVPAADGHVVRDPKMVRRFLLEELQPLATLMRTFAVGQLVIAFAYHFFFLGLRGLIEHFHGQVNEVMVIAIGVVLFASGVFVYAGAHAVEHGKWRLIATTGAVFAVTSPLLLGLPIGVWALCKLNRPEGRAVFQ
jgi:hypothetical protein